jgi:hypothetical protein
MKVFLASGVFFGLALAGTGLVYERIAYSATEAYSAESARVGHDNPVDGRLGWSPDL